jgi:hypothetical protein
MATDLGLLMNTLRDPAGLPAHPAVFQSLMLLTWIFHIAFVLLTLGAAGVAIWTYRRRDQHEHWARLSEALTQVAKVGVSLLIVLGVAPLLFTQVIYDPQWYTSNLLSARWAITFIFTLIVGYCLWFYFYAGNHGRPASRWFTAVAMVSLGIFVLDGLIMHALSYQSLLPEQWASWYAPGGVVDTSGSRLHAIQPARFLFIMSLSVPAIGLYLLAYADYCGAREDADPAYLDRVRPLGKRLAVQGLLISAVIFLGWQVSNPLALNLWRHPIGWLLFVWCVGLAWWVHSRESLVREGYLALASGLGMLGVLAVWREVIRMAHLAPWGYTIADYPVHADWPSLVLFALTFVGVGGLVGGYYLRLLYRAGLSVGVYTADRWTARLGTAAVGVLALWIMVFFTYGISIYIRNVFQ